MPSNTVIITLICSDNVYIINNGKYFDLIIMLICNNNVYV